MDLFSWFCRPALPETANDWSTNDWSGWLRGRARLYALAKTMPDRRAAFSPFLIEPTIETPIAQQLLRQVRSHAPKAEPKLCAAACSALGVWSPLDGEWAASFYLRLLTELAALVEAEALHRIIVTIIGRIGPPLAASALQDVLDETIQCGIARLGVDHVRVLASAVGRRAYEWRLQPWRAQLALLQHLLQTEGSNSFFSNLQTCLPEIDRTFEIRAAKHYLADVIVDALGLSGLAEVMSESHNGPQSLYKSYAELSVFPYRVERNRFSWRDRLTGQTRNVDNRPRLEPTQGIYESANKDYRTALKRSAFYQSSGTFLVVAGGANSNAR